MHENKFEKEVQKKMDELSFSPSPEVWQKVEEEIRKKKERRRIIFWLFPLFIATGAGVWYTASKSSVANKEVAGNSVLPTTSSKHSIAKQNTLFTKSNKKKTDVIIVEKNPKHSIKQNNSLATAGKFYFPKQKKYSKLLKQKATITSFENNEENVVGNKLYNKAESLEIIPSHSIISDTLESKVEIINNQPQQDSATKKEEIKQDSATLNPPLKKEGTKKEKWATFITLQAGVSSYKEGILAQNNVFSYSPSSPVGVGPGLSTPYLPSPGFSFVIGGGVMQSLSKRIKLSAGLQYHYYSTHMMVGSRQQNPATVSLSTGGMVVSSYYSNTASAKYTNHFYILELPVSLHYKLIKSVPLYASVGAGYGRLLHSNALTFDYNSNLFYYNKNNNNRNYFHLSSSLEYTFSMGKKWKLNAGPAIQFAPTEIQKENTYSISHLFFWGVKTGITF